MKFKILTLFTFVFSWCLTLSAQTVSVKGTVTDENKVPLPGVSVFIKNTTRGVATDFDGKYEIKANQGEVLEFHSVGFATQEKVVKLMGGGKTLIINVIMKEEAQQLGDVVVVGFGTQKKESVVSSISTVKGADLRVPTRNLTNNLAGQISGLIAIQRSGEPGYDSSEFYIRGISSFAGGKNPLVLVDGVPRAMNDIEPDEIETFTILKDAAATAIYGAEGANGVVLITSKRGKEQKTQISYRGEYGFLSPTRLPSFLDAPNYMRIYNESLQNSGLAPIFTEDIIAKHASGVDPDLYPNVNWMELVKRTTSNVRHTLNFRGGGEKARFFISGAFFSEDGLFKQNPNVKYVNNIGVNRYNLRSNVDFNVTSSTLLSVDMSGQYLENNFLGVATDNFLRQISITPPYLFPMIYSDGTFAAHPRNGTNRENPYNILMEYGYKKEWRSMLQSNVSIEQNLDIITEGLKAKGSVSYDYNSNYYMSRTKKPEQFKATGRDADGKLLFSKVVDEIKFGDPTESNNSEKKIYLEGSLNYKRIFGQKHDVTGMLLYYRKETQLHNQALAFRKEAFIGRATYMFDRRYSIEANFGFTGSEAFSKGNRFGFFPAVGVSWIASNEKFLEGMNNVVNDLKFRASYGRTGNDHTGGERFLYRGTFNTNAGGYHIGIGGSGALNHLAGAIEGRFEAPEIGWEIEDKRNVGVDFSLFQNRISVTADFFDNERYSILLQRRTVPQMAGFRDRPWQNYGRVSNKGFDASVALKHNFTDHFLIGARGNFTYAKNKVLEYDEVPQKYEWMNVTGRSINVPSLLIAEGLYHENDFNVTIDPNTGAKQYALKEGLPVSTISSGVLPGDIKYKDLNGDGIINDYDKTRDATTYSSIPEVVYGFGFNMEYKNFYANVFFQGVTNVITVLGGDKKEAFFPFEYGVDEGALRTQVADRWTVENPSENVLYPRLRNIPFLHNSTGSTWWLRDASFLRLKNIEIGYRLPKEVLNILKMRAGRFYLIGNNIHVWDKIKLWDPEMGNSNAGMKYPLPQSYTFGVEFNF
ncbi:SusC/RagA family TonB-linked outer membrane protein [Capnocytophaga canis]|uniref:SusC/RagA family TonB-linked outer membrane protein n=1 Tax=Capnocytophaga canis TaxID=1848903 RepID=UPI001562B665|nr:TonB-dependent receptor [Capnocytophaga canis]